MTPSPVKHQPKAGHRVHINVGPGGLLYTNPDGHPATSITVKKGDVVTWHAPDGNYSILFKKTSPFADVAYHGKRGTDSQAALVVGGKGSYHYAVTVALDSGLIVDDPEIIVDDGD